MIRLAVRVRREHAELVLAELLELCPSGVEEVEGSGSTVEYAVYGAPGELPSLPDVRAAASGALVEISTSEIADDWNERWRSFHRPVTISPMPRDRGARLPTLRVRPPWEAPAAVAARRTAVALPSAEQGSAAAVSAATRSVSEIVIDPGQAFGTGAHASTRLCLELLLALAGEDERRATLIDAGTGSGIIAIAAVRLGYRPVLGLDNDPASLAAARANAAANQAEVDVRSFDLRREPLPRHGEHDVVAANLLRPLLLALAERMRSAPAHLIAGGLLAGQADEVAAAFAARLGMRERDRRHSGEWAALWLLR